MNLVRQLEMSCKVAKKIKAKEPDKARNWGVVTLRNKTGGGSHPDKNKYDRRKKHKGVDRE